MWGFGKSRADVWSSLLDLSRRAEEDLQSRVSNLLADAHSSSSSTATSSSISSKVLSSESNTAISSHYVVIWDSALGRVPFTEAQILANLISLPCTSQAPLRGASTAHSVLQAIYDRNGANTTLKNLLVCTAASLESLDLDVVFSALTRPLPGSEGALYEQIEAIDIFIGDNPSKSPVELRERVKRKIAPVGHTPLASIGLHPLNAIYTPLYDRLLQIHCDPSTMSVGVSPANLVEASGKMRSLSRPENTSNRAHLQVEFDMLPREAKEKYVSVARTIAGMALDLGVRFEPWSLGPSSLLVAQQLSHMTFSHDTSSSTGEKVSLLLVDRSLDFLSPASFGNKSLLDRFLLVNDFSLLSKNINSSSSTLDNSIEGLANENPIFSPFASSHSGGDDDILLLLEKTPKEALAGLVRKLSDLATEEGIDVDFSEPGVKGAKNALSSIYTAWSETISGRSRLFKHRKLLLGADLACSLQDETLGRTSEFGPLFSTLKHILSAPGESPMHYIKDYIDASRNQPVSVVLRAVTSLFILSRFTWPSSESSPESSSKTNQRKANQSQKEEEEELLREISQTISNRIYDEMSSMTEPSPRWLDDKSSVESIRKSFDSMIEYVRSESEIGFEDFFTVQEEPKEPCLLAQLVSRVFDSSNPDMRDLKIASMSLGGLLKSGLSMVSLRHQPRPNDRHTVILFVLGGITFHETLQVRSMFNKSSCATQNKNQLIIASNSLISSLSLADLYCL